MAVGTLVKMKVLGLDHIHFTVRDLEEALAFYKKLGFKLERRLDHDGESAQLRISPGGVVIDIHLAKTVENPGYNHFAVSVDKMDAAVKELRDQGFKVDGPFDVAATGRRLATIRDPSGFLLQLVEAKKE